VEKQGNDIEEMGPLSSLLNFRLPFVGEFL
jgi:hypothetical protein